MLIRFSILLWRNKVLVETLTICRWFESRLSCWFGSLLQIFRMCLQDIFWCFEVFKVNFNFLNIVKICLYLDHPLCNYTKFGIFGSWSLLIMNRYFRTWSREIDFYISSPILRCGGFLRLLFWRIQLLVQILDKHMFGWFESLIS